MCSSCEWLCSQVPLKQPSQRWGHQFVLSALPHWTRWFVFSTVPVLQTQYIHSRSVFLCCSQTAHNIEYVHPSEQVWQRIPGLREFFCSLTSIIRFWSLIRTSGPSQTISIIMSQIIWPVAVTFNISEDIALSACGLLQFFTCLKRSSPSTFRRMKDIKANHGFFSTHSLVFNHWSTS